MWIVIFKVLQCIMDTVDIEVDGTTNIIDTSFPSAMDYVIFLPRVFFCVAFISFIGLLDHKCTDSTSNSNFAINSPSLVPPGMPILLSRKNQPIEKHKSFNKIPK